MPNERFINFYKHEDCDGANIGDVEYPSFTSRSDSITNDKCPECGCELEPYRTVDNPAYIEPEPEADPEKVIVIEIRKGCIYAVDNVPDGYTVECRDFDVEDTNQSEFDALPRFDGEPAHVSHY